ncbi:GGDEF domain-containing protein [Rubellimicrobium arenae]|uniref:GGDEF domain-containing protein n=1 Tax=Rubellimicrobium arenae TaxID=2817372 RepID=UPI001B30A3B8|nr:diguanylate cyclase [Rubellimicrobium arenae]
MDTLKDLSGTMALLALLAVVYGVTLRRFGPARGARVALGVVFGAAAILAMGDRIPVTEGVFVDLRNLPVALAGAFLGLPGASVALAMAVAGRLGIGGSGAMAGIASSFIAAAAGLAWDRRTRSPARRGTPTLLGLALATSAHPLGAFLLPLPVAMRTVAAMIPILLPIHILGILMIGCLIERERASHARERALRRAAEHDPLTGLLNRRGFERGVARCDQSQGGALLLLDVDHFKRINDDHGHPAGDAVLRAMGDRMASVLRKGDLVARLGGEELAVFLPGQPAAAARVVARRLCEVVRARPFALPAGGTAPITVSVGGAWGRPASLDRLIARADAALYAAKHAGRDRCRFASDRPGPLASIPAATESACADCVLRLTCLCDSERDVQVERLDHFLPSEAA